MLHVCWVALRVAAQGSASFVHTQLPCVVAFDAGWSQQIFRNTQSNATRTLCVLVQHKKPELWTGKGASRSFGNFWGRIYGRVHPYSIQWGLHGQVCPPLHPDGDLVGRVGSILGSPKLLPLWGPNQIWGGHRPLRPCENSGRLVESNDRSNLHRASVVSNSTGMSSSAWHCITPDWHSSRLWVVCASSLSVECAKEYERNICVWTKSLGTTHHKSFVASQTNFCVDSAVDIEWEWRSHTSLSPIRVYVTWVGAVLAGTMEIFLTTVWWKLLFRWKFQLWKSVWLRSLSRVFLCSQFPAPDVPAPKFHAFQNLE